MVKKIGTSKNVKELIKIAKSQGFEVRMTGGKHIQFVPPDKTQPMIVTALTSSDHRGILDLKMRLKKAGLNLKGKK